MILKQKMAEKNIACIAEPFQVKIGASAKKVPPPQFLRGKKSKKFFQLAKNPTETLVRKAKKPKNTMLRGQQDGTCEVYKWTDGKVRG